MYQKRPNFFIVGAAKSGTTSLWQYLKEHPEVYMPEDELCKEPSFFSYFGESQGIDNYLALFDKASSVHKWVGEASAAYLTDPVSANRIFDFNKQAKIIIILRNPAERAYSLYNWMVQDGYEYAASFDEALIMEEIRKNREIPNWFEPQYYWNYMYFGSGLYYEQVRRYIDLFRKNVLILKFDDLMKDPKDVYEQICHFLKIEPTSVVFRNHNVSHMVASAKVQFILRHLNGFIGTLSERNLSQREINRQVKKCYREYVRKLSRAACIAWRDRITGEIILQRVLSSLKKWDINKHHDIISKKQRDRLLTFGLVNKKPVKLSQESKTTLLKKYYADIMKLSTITGMDLSGWLQD